MPRLKDVIVFLPGIMGSVLQRHGKDVWAPSAGGFIHAVTSRLGDIQSLKMTTDPVDQPDLGDGVVATRLMPSAQIIPGLWKIDGYSETSEAIEQVFTNVKLNRNYFEFPYDWRRDNRVAAIKLQKMTTEWLANWRAASDGDPDARLILIAHSMGGLVARYFLEVLGGWRSTRALITFGTPYSGSLNALNFLANGYRKAFNLVDMSEMLQSFNSIYQLLPTYKCCDYGEGELFRADNPRGIPHVDPARVSAAFAFHREIADSQAKNSLLPDYVSAGYRIYPVVGTQQPTLQSARIVQGSSGVVQLISNYLGQDYSGDGTVPRVSATPLEWKDSSLGMFVADRHASLQYSRPVLDYLDGLLTGLYMESAIQRNPDVSGTTGANSDRSVDAANLRSPGLVRLSVSLDDAFATGEPILIRARPDRPTAMLKAVIQSASDNAFVAEQQMSAVFDDVSGSTLGTVFPPLPQGLYRITVQGNQDVLPVTDIFEVYTAATDIQRSSPSLNERNDLNLPDPSRIHWSDQIITISPDQSGADLQTLLQSHPLFAVIVHPDGWQVALDPSEITSRFIGAVSLIDRLHRDEATTTVYNRSVLPPALVDQQRLIQISEHGRPLAVGVYDQAKVDPPVAEHLDVADSEADVAGAEACAAEAEDQGSEEASNREEDSDVDSEYDGDDGGSAPLSSEDYSERSSAPAQSAPPPEPARPRPLPPPAPSPSAPPTSASIFSKVASSMRSYLPMRGDEQRKAPADGSVSAPVLGRPAREGSLITRYPSIDLAGDLSAGGKVGLVIDLALVRDLLTDTTGINLTLPDDWDEVVVAVKLVAPELIFRTPVGSILLRNGKSSIPWKIQAIVSKDLASIDRISIRASFEYDGRFIGSARRAFRITTEPASQPLAASESTSVAAALQSQTVPAVSEPGAPSSLPGPPPVPQVTQSELPLTTTAGTFSLNTAAPAPTLTIQMFRLGTGQFYWHLSVPTDVATRCKLPSRMAGPLNLGSSANPVDPPAYVAALFAVASSLSAPGHVSFFEGLGEKLYQLTPPFFQQAYWALVAVYGFGFPIQIVGDDPYVPWELMRPSDETHPPEYLGVRHPVARWFLDYEGSRSINIPLGRVATIAPDYTRRPPVAPLAAAQNESREILRKLGPRATAIPADTVSFIGMFEDTQKSDYALIHYAGHGACKTDQVDYAYLMLENGDVHVFDVRRKLVALGANRHSLVFLNACQVGQSGLNLAVIGGFAEALMNRQFGGLVAPLWSVYDDPAKTCSTTFIQDVLGGTTFAQALQEIRRNFGADSPTYLSYIYYGDVMAAFC